MKSKVVTKFESGLYTLHFRFLMLVAMLANSPVACALAKGKKEEEEEALGAGEKAVNDLFNAKDNGAFDSGTAVTKDIGASSYKLLISTGGVCLVLALICAGIYSAYHSGNQMKNAENKDWVVRIALGGCIVFGSITLMSIVVGIAGSIGAK